MSEPLRFLSVCSGIEAASVAFNPLGFEAVGFAEIDKAASKVLAHHYPDVPNFGDFTTIDRSKLGRVDLLCGGTPCQAFSIAGSRGSLSDARGNLTLSFVELAHGLARDNGLRNALWENVPGVLNTPDNAFGCFLGAIVGADDALHTPDGEGWPNAGMVAGPRARLAWRVLDAQFFGLAQRRKRVFVVADFGNGADPAAVLFERKSRDRHSPPSRKAREGIAPTLSARTKGGGGLGTDFDCDGGLIPQAFGGGNTSGPIDAAACLTAKGQRIDFEVETFVAQQVAYAIQERAVSENINAGPGGTGVQEGIAYTLEARHHVQAVAFQERGLSDYGEGGSPTLRAKGGEAAGGSEALIAQAFDLRGREGGAQFEGPHDTANIRAASGGSSRSYVAQQWAVRRLTPMECARLQGFPDDYLDCVAADGPKYKMLGNSWAVPVISWIGKRLLDAMEAAKCAA